MEAVFSLVGESIAAHICFGARVDSFGGRHGQQRIEGDDCPIVIVEKKPNEKTEYT